MKSRIWFSPRERKSFSGNGEMLNMRNLHQQLNLVLHRFSLRLGFACFAALWKVKYTEASDSFHLDFFVCVHSKLHLMVFRSLTGCGI